ncbi:MAG: TolC family protein [Candidatus Acidiferrales bacterium]
MMKPRSFPFVVDLLLAAVSIFARPSAAQTAPAQSAPMHVPPGQPATPQTASPQAVQSLTLQDAEKIAIQNHPQVQVATYLAAAAQSRVSQVESLYYPQAFGSVTGAYAENDSRIAAGGLNNPIVFNRFAEGVTVSQLVTDFGRTHELVKSSKYAAQAEQANVTLSRADVLLGADRAYYAVLKAQAVLKVADETVKARQLVAEQITTLANNKLKSGLDVSFANVDLAQARLLQIQARNDLDASLADLSAALGYSDQRAFNLADDTQNLTQPLQPPPVDFNGVLQLAMQNRPELIGQRFELQSAQSYARAERDLWFPTLSAVGAAGLIPYRADTLASRYAAGGFNVNIPIFNGHLFGALRSEADARENAQQQFVRDLQNRITRDVRAAWLNANSAFERLSVTEQFLAQARQAFELAQARYKLGLSSIIELSQAQLNLTQAEIAEASAKYDYEIQSSTLNYQTGLLH